MDALPGWYIGRGRARSWGAASLMLLALHGLTVAMEAGKHGVAFDAVEPWPLGGGTTGLAVRGASLMLGWALGWAVPGLPLALVTDRSLAGGRLLARAFGLGIGYIVGGGLAMALLTGGAPGRTALLVSLALPGLAAVLLPDVWHERPRDWPFAGVCLSMLLLTACLWPKLAHEGLNGDGTEAYELARSLDRSVLARWDLERPEGPGAYGYPAVNPFLTNSYLVHAQMAVLGRGELAARMPFTGGLVAATVLAAALSGRAGASAWIYAGLLGTIAALWNSYYVGYEAAFADLAEPAATDLTMTGLLLAGGVELAAGSLPLAVTFLLLASGVLYSAPLLATITLVLFAGTSETLARRALLLWVVVLGSLAAVAAFAGLATGSLPDWVRQLQSEYWEDFVDDARSVPVAPLLGRLLLATGALPLVALVRFRRLEALPRALLVAAAAYVAIVAISRHKNLHYLTPVPFLLAPAALQASTARLRVAAAALIAAALALSWPSPREVHRESTELGRRSCLDGVDVETAALGGDVLYQAFAPPGGAERFAIGKHTFARYAADLGGHDCRFRLSPLAKDGWVSVAGDPSLAFSVRDVDEYVRWRFSRPGVPSSPLFRRRVAPALSPEPEAWNARYSLAEAGQLLVLDGFARRRSTEAGNPPAYISPSGDRPRLLVPRPAASSVRVRAWAPDEGIEVALWANGRPGGALHIPPGWSEVTLPTQSMAWRSGWNVLELAGDARLTRLALDWLEVARDLP